MIINNRNVRDVLVLVKYVNISFTYNFSPQTTDQMSMIVGGVLTPPLLNPLETYEETGRIDYYVIYDWLNNGDSIPLLVPNTDTNYVASYCNLDIPSSTTVITVDENGNQSVVGDFLLNSEKPLYFTASTIDNQVVKEVYVSSIRSLDNQGNYIHELSFYVSNANVQAGSQKQLTVDMKLFKDMICSKYLGTISFNINLVSTVGPGE